nr:HAD hydrolase-like protein [Candidatus Saccharibacteria bacterium]
MKELLRKKNTPRFVPDYLASSLTDIDFALLKKRGVKYIAFDADSTLVPSRGKLLEPKTEAFLKKQRPLFKDWCIASNRITNDLLPLAKAMDAHVIQATILIRKPQRRFYAWVLNYFKPAKPEEIAMIGDKLIAEMFGGKRAGMTTVWVEKIGKDNPWDQLLQVRHFEKRLMKAYIK